MRPIQMLGVVVCAVGLILLGFAYHASNAPLERLSNTFTGQFTNQTTWWFVLGGGAALGGALLALFGKRSQ